jgi:hypothetical protein
MLMSVFDHNHHDVFALCNIKSTNQQYGLVYVYGDPHHRSTNAIWDQVLHFVTLNTNMPIVDSC